MSEISLPQEIISPEVYEAVVQEIGKDGGELLAAVEASNFGKEMLKLFSPKYLSNLFPSQFDSSPDKIITTENIKTELPPQEPEDQESYNNEQTYNEDQKNFIPWNQQAQFEAYSEHGPVVYASHAQLPIPQIPSNVDYAGELDFDILITSHTANRNSWIYSPLLNKVFINMQNILPIDVKHNPTSDGSELFLRATLLYSLPQFAQELVERCSAHVDSRLINNRDVESHVIKHVLRCTNPGSIYMGNTERKEHLSVITQLQQPQAGVQTVRVNYQFMCKNSCPAGMNRRAVDVIFTLEDACGRVLGRRKLSVRVCSCPKRDKEKEEKEYRDQMDAHNHGRTPTTGRKRKMTYKKAYANSIAESNIIFDRSHTDNFMYKITSLEVVGKDIALDTLRFAQDRMLAEIQRGRYDEEREALVKECVHKITNNIKKLAPE